MAVADLFQQPEVTNTQPMSNEELLAENRKLRASLECIAEIAHTDWEIDRVWFVYKEACKGLGRKITL